MAKDCSTAGQDVPTSKFCPFPLASNTAVHFMWRRPCSASWCDCACTLLSVPLTISHPMWAPKEGYNLGRGGSLPTRAVSGRVPHSECLSLEGASGWHQSMHLCGGLCVLTRGSISTTWETAVLEPRTAWSETRVGLSRLCGQALQVVLMHSGLRTTAL